MGFEINRARKILKHFKNNINHATDHLLTVDESNDNQVLGIS
jgi:hypothetical protein